MPTGQGNPASFGGNTLFSAVSNSASNTTDINAGDGIVFDTLDASNGTAAVYDAATGIWALEAGRTYRLTGNLGGTTFSGADGIVVVRWFDLTAAAFFGNAGEQFPTSATAHISAVPEATAIFTPTVASTVELRIVSESDLTEVSDPPNLASAFIQTL